MTGVAVIKNSRHFPPLTFTTQTTVTSSVRPNVLKEIAKMAISLHTPFFPGSLETPIRLLLTSALPPTPCVISIISVVTRGL